MYYTSPAGSLLVLAFCSSYVPRQCPDSRGQDLRYGSGGQKHSVKPLPAQKMTWTEAILNKHVRLTYSLSFHLERETLLP